MRIAVLSDLHGNRPALDSALRDVADCGADALVVLGDLIGYYHDASGVLDVLDDAWPDWEKHAIRGNHETLFERALRDPSVAETYRTKYGSALDVAAETLSASQIERLLQLPESRLIDLGGVRLALHHGAPFDPDAYVYPDAPDDSIAACCVPGADWVLLGHTHYPMQRGPVLNPGSVGQPRDAGGAAAWALLDTSRGASELRRAPYDPAALAAETRRRDPHLPYNADILFRTPARTT